MKKMSWIRYSERLGRECGTVLALGFNKDEEFICSIKEGEYAYIIHMINGNGNEEDFCIQHSDEKILKFDNILDKKCGKGKICDKEADELFLKKICTMAQKIISNR